MPGRFACIELQLLPGALTDDTDLAAKLRAIDMDKVRFRGNRAETIKAWQTFNASGMSAGTARGIHTYTDLDGDPIVVAASESAVNAWKGGTRFIITPLWRDIWLDRQSPTTPNTIRWIVYNPATDTGVEIAHGLAVGDVVTFSNVIGGGGGLAGTFTIASVPSDTTFTVTSATFGSDPEAAFTCTVAFKNGLATGTGDTFATRTRVWSIDNFGENAVFCGSDGTPVFVWQPDTETANLLVDGGFSGSGEGDDSWDGTGWTSGGGSAGSTGLGPNTLKQNVSVKLVGGKGYEMVFTISGVTATTLVDSFRVQIDDVDIFPPLNPKDAEGSGTDFNKTYTFRFTCPANPKFLIFTATATGTGANSVIRLDDVSIKFQTKAFPLSEAPYKNLALFVDGNRILSVIGSVEADGDFDAGLLRWCDQDNYREWVPNTTNVAGELPLGKGSYAVCGAQVGERNLILTDGGAYAASFNGSGYSVRQIGVGCGAIGTRAMAVYNNRAFWAGDNAFYAYDGTQIAVIECPLKDHYVGKLKLYQENKTFAWANFEYGEVWFHHTHTDDGTEVTRYAAFAFIEQTNPWSFGTFNRTCFAPATVYPKPIAIDTSRNIWNHEIGNAMPGTGIVLPFIETGYLVGQAGDRWVGCRRYYPDIENQVGNIKFTITGKRAPQGQNNTQSIGPLLMIPDENKLDFVLSCRQLKFKWESETTPTNWRLGVVGLEMKADKERR